MCSIMGYFGCVTREIFDIGFNKTISRGPDDTRVARTRAGLMGFHRLSIMGLHPEGMQPFELDGSLVICNGELYGFHKRREALRQMGYEFKSDSDCEILLPMYFEYGLDMFSMLDAEFALILYDARTGEYIAARDPIGIRPLYYGHDEAGGIIFASEPKNIMPYSRDVMPFPPGCYYKNGSFTRFSDIASADTVISRPIDEICGNIREKLVAGVEKRLVADANIGFLLSGGLDSSLVCAIAAKKLPKPIRTFAIGMTGDAIDLKYARIVADYIGSEHTEVIISKRDVLMCIERVVELLATYDITTVRASIGMYLLCKAIRETTDIRVLLTGEVSDELFGYKYTDFAPDASAFQLESEKRVRELHMFDVLRADRCISVNSLEARVPFGDLDFVKYVLNIDPLIKLNSYGMGKYILRRAFEGDYLPREILWREKAAFSDAVGHSMVNYIKEYADTLYTDSEYDVGRLAYTHCAPFTKESLMYRDMFEKYYPGQSRMIAGFWMPNKLWRGCDVDDPSARVLANYGKSGE